MKCSSVPFVTLDFNSQGTVFFIHSVSILVRAAIIEYHSFGGSGDRIVIVLEARKSKIKKISAELVSREDLLPGLYIAVFSLYLHIVDRRKRKQVLSCLFLKEH